jgi:hypothetical protein
VVTTLHRPDPTPQPPRKPGHEVALWAGVVSFFGSLIAIGVFDIFNPSQWVEYLGAILVAAITAGGVYSKQRLDDAKREEKGSGQNTP